MWALSSCMIHVFNAFWDARLFGFVENVIFSKPSCDLSEMCYFSLIHATTGLLVWLTLVQSWASSVLFDLVASFEHNQTYWWMNVPVNWIISGFITAGSLIWALINCIWCSKCYAWYPPQTRHPRYTFGFKSEMWFALGAMPCYMRHNWGVCSKWNMCFNHVLYQGNKIHLHLALKN